MRLGLANMSLGAEHGLPDESPMAMEGTIKVLEAAVEKKPREWVYWFRFADYCHKTGHILKAVQACERCFALRPKDVRSVYALAKALRSLAVWSQYDESRDTYMKDTSGHIDALRDDYVPGGVGPWRSS
jgi:predicted TPR repeat methyltransferase